MDRESNQMEQHPVRCRNGCGFYGNSGTEGLCSVCYKEIIKKKQQPPANMPSSLASTTSSSSSTSAEDEARSSISTASPTVLFSEKSPEEGAAAASSSSEGMALSDSEGDGQRNPKKKKNKCLTCKKKVGLTGFSCRCGGLFCALHRYSDKHDCNFDYKELGAEEIRKHNPVVVAAKVQKI